MTALWGFTGPRDDILAQRMRAAVAHRGATETVGGAGTWSTAVVTLGVGLPRPDVRLGGLAISPRTGACLAVAGRLPRGTRVTDLVQSFDDSGISALEATPGEWIIAVATDRCLSVLRDPAGARTAYWARYGGRVLVAVEPKGIHTLPGFRRVIDPAALARYLTFSFVPGAGTMLADLAELQAGHRLDVDVALDTVERHPLVCARGGADAELGRTGTCVGVTHAPPWSRQLRSACRPASLW